MRTGGYMLYFPHVCSEDRVMWMLHLDLSWTYLTGSHTAKDDCKGAFRLRAGITGPWQQSSPSVSDRGAEILDSPLCRHLAGSKAQSYPSLNRKVTITRVGEFIIVPICALAEFNKIIRFVRSKFLFLLNTIKPSLVGSSGWLSGFSNWLLYFLEGT